MTAQSRIKELKRVVVTGMGIISPVGNSVAEAWGNVRAGKSGIDWQEGPDLPDNAVLLAGKIKDFDAEALFGRRVARRSDPAAQFALAATQQALDDSGLPITDNNAYDIACIIGTGMGGFESVSDTIKGYANRGPSAISPAIMPSILSDNISGTISITHGLRGQNFAVVTACASSNNSIGAAFDLIRLGRARAAVTGGTEASTSGVPVAAFNNMKALTRYEGDDPTAASRPFDLTRDGFVIAEGSAILILEELEHARERGAHIYCELTGYGHTSDAFHVTAPMENGEAAAHAMKLALEDAGLAPEEIDYINAHGTSTPLNDKTETRAIKLALGERAYDLPISSTKSMHGHILGATSAVEAVLSIMAMQDNFVPPTLNLNTPDPECDLDYVPHEGRPVEINHVLSNAFGFGGHNAVLAFSRYN